MKKVVTDNLIKFTGLAFGTRVPVNKYWVWNASSSCAQTGIMYHKMVWAHRILSKGIEGSKRLRSSFKIYMDTDYLTDVTEVNSSDIVKEPGR